METTSKSRIHPLVASAAVAIILVCLVGVAAITGLIPGVRSANAPASQPLVAANAPLAVPAGVSADEKAALQRDADNAAHEERLARERADKAAAAARSAQRSANNAAAADVPYNPPVAAICENCGRVESIREIRHAAKPSGLGIAAGAVLGGILGNQVGGGTGRTVATVAGAVGGGYAGNEVEKRTHTTNSYEVVVRMENGSVREFTQSGEGWQVGDRVRVVNGALRSRG